MKTITLKEQVNALRGELKSIGDKFLGLRRDNEFTPPADGASASVRHLHRPNVESVTASKPTPDYAEMQANLQLAFRHIEDARMRAGKVIQALEGGESIYG